jgi:hypothetical protein
MCLVSSSVLELNSPAMEFEMLEEKCVIDIVCDVVWFELKHLG